MSRQKAHMGLPSGGRIRRLIGRIERWHRLSVRRRILVAMLAVSVIPLAIFSLAGLAALSGLNSGALKTADKALEASQDAHLQDLVHSKALVINNELQSVQDQVALLSQSTDELLAQPPVQPTGAPGITIYGPGANAALPSSNVLALQALGAQLALVFNLHPEVADVWVQLPQSRLVAVAPATAIPSAQEASVGELSPTPAEYQAGVDRQTADLNSPHWRALVPHSTRSVVWTPVYDNPAAGGRTITLATETVSSNGIPFWVGANITVKNLVSTFLSGAPGHAEGGYAFLVSSDGPVGTVLSYSPGGAAGLGFGPKKSRAAAVNLTSQDSPWLAVGNSMTLGLSGHGTINLEGAPVSVFYSPLPASQWSLGVAIPVSGINGSVVGFSQTINRGLFGVTALLLPFLIILAALVVVLTNLLSRRLLLPLSNLTGASRRIAGGDLVTPVAVAPGPRDEVGTLEMALEGMRKRLAGQHQIIEASRRNLEQRVEERTSELRQRNDELATLNSVSADLSRSLVLSDVATGAAEQLRQLWRVSQVSVYLLDQTAPEGVRLVGQSMEGDPGDDPRPELSAALAMSDQTSATPMQVDDLVVVPLQVTGTKVGYLVLRQAQLPGRRQIEMLEVVGGQLALALRNAQLFADTQEMATINERNRIAREIHDTIAQGLAGIIIQLQAAEAWMEREPKRSQQALGHAAALARSSLQEARRSVWDLRPELLERGGLGSALKEELAQAQARTGVKTSVKLRGLRQLTLPAATEVSIFRIVQEAVANSLHHARPTGLAVEVARNDGHLRVEIADDGCGFDPARPGRVQAFGLTSMRERATACGGSFSLSSAPGKGTRVVLEIPVPEPASAKPLP